MATQFDCNDSGLCLSERECTQAFLEGSRAAQSSKAGGDGLSKGHSTGAEGNRRMQDLGVCR